MPYVTGGGVNVAESSLMDTVSITGYYSVNPGRALDLDYDAMLNEAVPTSTQITI